MAKKLLISLLICAFAATAVKSVEVEVDPVLKLRSLLNSYRSFVATNYENDFPVHSFDEEDDRLQKCFDDNILSSTESKKNYQASLNGCTQTAQKAKDEQAILNAEKRTDLTNRGKKVTDDLDDCNGITDTLDFLNCYEKACSSNAENLYKVSQDSGEQFNAVKIKYEEIDNVKTVCTNTARRQYTADVAAGDKELQNCILGITVEPTESTTPGTTEGTTEETTEEPTDEPTEEPTEETEEPTDEPPVETDEPEPERSPEEDIYSMIKSAQARRYLLKHVQH